MWERSRESDCAFISGDDEVKAVDGKCMYRSNVEGRHEGRLSNMYNDAVCHKVEMTRSIQYMLACMDRRHTLNSVKNRRVGPYQ